MELNGQADINARRNKKLFSYRRIMELFIVVIVLIVNVVINLDMELVILKYVFNVFNANQMNFVVLLCFLVMMLLLAVYYGIYLAFQFDFF